MRVAYLAQEVTLDSRQTVFEVVAGGLPELGRMIIDYHQAVAALERSQDEASLQRLAELQHHLEAAGGWELEQRVERVLSRLQLDGDAGFHTLSGGWRRRVMLARALVQEPDVLITLSQEAYFKFRPTARKGAKILIDSGLVIPAAEDAPLKIPATKLAEDLGNRIVTNLIILGFFTAVTDIVSRKAMEEAIKTSVKARFVDLNLKAFAAGFDYAQEKVYE